MAERLSLGAVQVGSLTIQAINDALRQLQERIDAMKGLSGGVTVHDTETADAFRVEDDNGQVIHGLGTTE